MIKKNEMIIRHHGKCYVGTLRDYMMLCNQDPGSKPNLREATSTDIELFGFRCEKKMKVTN